MILFFLKSLNLVTRPKHLEVNSNSVTMAENDTAKLMASSLDIKSKSRLIAGQDDYLLIIVKGGLDSAFRTKDPSYMGTFWLEHPDSPADAYMIFGPTEGQRELGGDQQRIINHYSLVQKTKVRAYITKSFLEIITIIHAKVAKASEELETRGGITEDIAFGFLLGKSVGVAIPILDKELSLFSVVFQNYLEG